MIKERDNSPGTFQYIIFAVGGAIIIGILLTGIFKGVSFLIKLAIEYKWAIFVAVLVILFLYTRKKKGQPKPLYYDERFPQ